MTFSRAQSTPDPHDLRRADAGDAHAIGAVVDAAVRAGWAYLGELAQKPRFTPEDWDRLVADHAPPKVLLVATDEAGRIVGYTAAHPETGETFLLFVDPAHAGRGIGRTLLSAADDALRADGAPSISARGPGSPSRLTTQLGGLTPFRSRMK